MDLTQALNKMIEFEEAGYIEEALKLAGLLSQIFPNELALILLEKAKMEFRNGFEKEALLDFIKAYELSGDKEIYKLVLAAYYEPNENMLTRTYDRNTGMLKEYPHYRNSFGDSKQETVPIWQDEELLVFSNIFEGRFKILPRNASGAIPEENDVFVAVNALWIQDILQYEAHFGIKKSLHGENLPLYLVYDKDCWTLFLQLYDIEPLLEKRRVVFIAGAQSFYEYLHEDMVALPNMVFCKNAESNYQSILNQAAKELIQEGQINAAESEHYYTVSKNEITARIKINKPKILFLTSRFTTVMQYHSKDCMAAAERLGCETRLLIEQDSIHCITQVDILKAIAQFKPDIIFCINHFAFEYQVVPSNVIWISWIQDPMPYAMDKETPAKLTDKNFIMSHYTTWKKFREVGYSARQLIDAPIPANPFVYKPYQIDHRVYEKYSCDICFVCHASDVSGYINNLVQELPVQWQKAVRAVCKEYQKRAYNEKFLYSEEAFGKFAMSILAEYDVVYSQETLQNLAGIMYFNFNQRVYRQALVDWILDAGFTNIKLWGNGWATEEKYKKYAMGPAENGETLSKIYQASKIVVGNNIMTTAAARAWETMLSGGFYLSNYIPEEEDAVDIRKILEVDKDVIMFYNREDLIQKLHYYLEHEDERQKMIQRGRKAALEKMTYDALMKKVLDEVAERLEERLQ